MSLQTNNSMFGKALDIRDYEGYKYDMIEKLKKKVPEYTDFSESDMGIVLIELLANQLDMLSYYQEVIAGENFLDTAQERESVVKKCRTLGYKLKESTPSVFKQVFEIMPSKDNFIIPKGTQILTEPNDVEKAIEFETMEDLVIPSGKTGLEKDEEGHYLYTVDLAQGYTINNEVVGSSTGAPNQTFLLNYKPVIENSVEVFVHNGFGFEKWERVDNFVDSVSTSNHYTIEMNEDGVATITFGNGISGKIPPRRNQSIVATYRVGGGTIGNVGPNTIVKMPQKLAQITQTFNPYPPYIKGKNKEDIETARIKAPAQLGTKWGVVTLSDFKNLALSVRGVIRSNAIPTPLNDRIIIYYYADDTVNDKELLNTLLELYDEKKIVTVPIRILKGETRPINIDVSIKIYHNYSKEIMRKTIETYLRTNIKAGAYDFKDCPENSDLVSSILDLDGVRSVDVTISNNENLKDNELITLGDFNIEVVGGK